MAKKGQKKTFVSVMKSKAGGYIVITVIFAVLLCVYPDNNLITWFQARQEVARQQKQMRQYQSEINAMQQRIDQLTTDRDTLEEFARENFHFAKPDEDIYLTER